MLSLVSRNEELKRLSKYLEQAGEDPGLGLIITGEAGIGKTRLVEELLVRATEFRVLGGRATPESSSPFDLFCQVLPELGGAIVADVQYSKLSNVFLMSREGELMVGGGQEGDSETIASILPVVGSFVRDSFEGGEGGGGLGRLEFGDQTILAEHGSEYSLVVVFSGREHENIGARLKGAMNRLGLPGVSAEDIVAELASSKFRVGRELEGIRLEAERMRISDIILDALSQMSREKPLLVSIEDLHWADESSLFAIGYISRNIGGKSIALISTARRGESALFDRTLESMLEEEIARELELRALDTRAMTSILEEMFPENEFPESFALELADRCGGNPFHTLETITQMQKDGTIFQSDGIFCLSEAGFSIPESMEELVNNRLDTFDPEMLAVVEYASCIGHTFDSSFLTESQIVARPEDMIKRLAEAGIILLDNQRAGFAHAIYQEVIYNGIDDRWKVTYHKTIGEYIEELCGPDREVELYELARHFSLTREWEKGFGYCREAALKAEEELAPELATSFFEKAISFGPKVSAASDVMKELYSRLGKSYYFMGDWKRSVEAFENELEMTASNEGRAMVLYQMARTYGFVGQYKKSFAISNEALELLEDEDHIIAATIANVMFWYYRSVGQYDIAREKLLRALEIATRADDRAVMGQCYHNLGTLENYASRFDDSIEYFGKAIELARERKSERAYYAALSNLSNVHYAKGDLKKTLEGWTECLGHFRKTGYKHAEASILSNLGVIYSEMEEYEKAIWHYKESSRIAGMIGVATLLINNDTGISSCYLRLGDPDSAMKHAKMALDMVRQRDEKLKESWAYVAIAEVETSLGNWNSALELFGKARKSSEEMKDSGYLAKIDFEEALMYKKMGDVARARELLKHSLSYNESIGAGSWVIRIKEALKDLD